MKQRFFANLMLAALTMSLGMMSAVAAAKDANPVAPAAEKTISAPAGVPLVFRQPVHLRGTIGDDGVQVAIRPKVPAEDGFEGEYFFFGQSLQILIAGDIDGEVLMLEESQDGKRISGQWDGTIAGDRVSGTWMSADGSVSKPFALQIMPPANASAAGRKRIAKP